MSSSITRLRQVLWDVQKAAGDNFSGVGVLISDAPDTLPLFAIRPISIPLGVQDLVKSLATISVYESEYHDGFHIVSSDWNLTRLSQYFSPPVATNITVDRTKLFGGRYLAALFGSVLPGVKLSGIASKAFGVAVFEQGMERVFEEGS